MTISHTNLLDYPLQIYYNDLASMATLWQHKVR